MIDISSFQMHSAFSIDADSENIILLAISCSRRRAFHPNLLTSPLQHPRHVKQPLVYTHTPNIYLLDIFPLPSPFPPSLPSINISLRSPFRPPPISFPTSFSPRPSPFSPFPANPYPPPSPKPAISASRQLSHFLPIPPLRTSAWS